MGSYQNPIGSPDPFDKYRAEAIEAKKRGRNSSDEEPPKQKEGLAAHLLQILQKAFNYFLEGHTGSKTTEIKIKESLVALKTSFEILKNEDRSQDIEFLNQLSSTWNHLLEESAELSDETEEKLKEFIKKILHYPENQPHTFGYYLTEYAGQKWIPFPYMELVQKIHSEHEKNPSGSALSDWAHLLDQMISSLNSK